MKHRQFDPIVFEKAYEALLDRQNEYAEKTIDPGQDALDYARCQRPDGTFYGTAGVCRKGVSVGPREKKALKKAAASGNKKAKVALAVVEGKMTKAQAKKELGAAAGASTKPEKQQPKKVEPEAKAKPKKVEPKAETAPKKTEPKAETAPKKVEPEKKEPAKAADTRPFAAEKLSESQLKELPDKSKVDMADGTVYVKKDGKFYREKPDGKLSAMDNSAAEIRQSAAYNAKVNKREGEGRGPDGLKQDDSLSGRFSRAKPLGEGGYGQVRVTDDGGVIKKGEIGKDEVAVQKKLEGVDGVPKVRNAEGNILEMDRARGKALMDSDIYDEAAYGSGASKRSGQAADDVVRLLKDTHSRGVSHGDLHDGNVFMTENGKAGLIDFGMGRNSSASALNEGLSFGADGNFKSGPWMSDLTRGGNAGPKWTRMQGNQAAVTNALVSQGFDPTKDLGSQGLTEAQAQNFISQLYEGI